VLKTQGLGAILFTVKEQSISTIAVKLWDGRSLLHGGIKSSL